jgi:FkbM family methyltransferase
MSGSPAHFRNVLAPMSQVRYAVWRVLGGKHPIDVKLSNGSRLRMRSLSTTDYDIAWQIYWRGDYEAPQALRDVRKVVDLGANVGYSCLYWCNKYPECRVTAFEPHPAHVAIMKDNLARNGLLGRVNVVVAAAGANERNAYLTDARTSSSVTEQAAGFEIRVLDIFQQSEWAMEPIDILKIDIEGGEYELLFDPRFRELNVRTLVIEWHNTQEYPDGKAVCLQKLHEFGYKTHIGSEDLPLAGLIWASR